MSAVNTASITYTHVRRQCIKASIPNAPLYPEIRLVTEIHCLSSEKPSKDERNFCVSCISSTLTVS